MKYYFSKTTNLPFDQAISRVAEALTAEGFGILTEIDVKETLKKKLNVDFRKYRILGACNPPFAFRALQAEDKIGVMLPCNFIVQEHAPGQVEISAVNPMVSMGLAENAELISVAREVQAKLVNIIDNL